MEVTLRDTLKGHQNPIYTIAIDSTNHLLYSAGNDKGIVEWDLELGMFKRVLCSVSASVYCLQLIPNTSFLIAGLRNGDILIIDRKESVLKARLRVDKGAVFAIQYLSSKNELLAIGEEGKAYVWDFESFELLYQFDVSKTTVRSITTTEHEEFIAFGDKEGHVLLYQTQDFQCISRKKIHETSVSSLTAIGEYLFSGGRDAKMYKLEIPTLEIVDSIVPHMFTVYSILRLEKDLFSTVSRDKTIKVWGTDLKLQKNISRDRGIESHHLSINTQDYDHHLKILATAGDDKLIKLWQLS